MSVFKELRNNRKVVIIGKTPEVTFIHVLSKLNPAESVDGKRAELCPALLGISTNLHLPVHQLLVSLILRPWGVKFNINPELPVLPTPLPLSLWEIAEDLARP